MTINIDNVFPLIVPAGYYIKGTSEFSNYRFPNESFILTWVVFNSTNAMLYLMQNDYQDLNTNYQNWQQKSFENLRHSMNENESFCTQFKMSDDGERLIFISFVHSDGIGSSRILFSSELTNAFPNGYYIAFPDRSCGLVIAKDITDEELTESKKLVKGMHETAITAMSDQLHSPLDFVLPELWTKPIDTEFSQTLISTINELRDN